jgi:hypothetical protein
MFHPKIPIVLGTNIDNEKKVQTIFTKKQYINLISCLIIWFGGVLLIIKTFDGPALKIIFYTIIFSTILIFIVRKEKYYNSFLTKNILFLVMLIVTASAILLYRFEYIGYSSIVGFIILWLFIIYQSQNVKTSLIQLAVFLLSPALYSGMISFSGLFSLSMLVALSILISERIIKNIKFDWKFFLIAFLFGVTLSAHLLVGLIYTIYLIYLFRNGLSKGLYFVLTMLMSYALSKFLLDKGYITMAALQTNYFQLMPIWIVIILVIAAIYIGWIVSDLQEIFFTNGLILFSIFKLSVLIRVLQFGESRSEFDFSLLIMAIPFLVLSIKEYKVDKYLGKVLD